MSATATEVEDLLTRLASPRGDSKAIDQLINGQYGKRLLQLRRMIDRCAAAPPPSDTGASAVDDWYALLKKAQCAAPAAFRGMLLTPDVAVLLKGPDADHGAVARIAAAAGALAGLPATVTIPRDNHPLFLPGLGVIITGCSPEPDHVVIRIASDGTRVSAGGVSFSLPDDLTIATDHWRPLDYFTVGDTVRLRVRFATDGPLADAMRAMYPADRPAAEGDTDAEWQRALAGAWRILENGHHDYASSISVGVHSLVPVRAAGKGDFVSGTLAGAFGAIALSMPSAPELFAVTLIHEFQHAKLDAALDLIRLYTPDDRALYYAPWRPDPRPLGAMLQGIYAHLGVSSFWGSQRWSADHRQRMRAHVEFVRWRDDTWLACRELLGSPALTAAGAEFVKKLFGELNRLRGEEVPAEAVRIAGLIGCDHRISWRLRNLEMDGLAARRFALAWLNDERPLAVPGNCVQRTNTPRTATVQRIHLLYRHLAGTLSDAQDESGAADLLYAQGDYRHALAAYETRIAEAPGDLDAWAGLALSAAATGITLDLLMSRPEVPAKIFQQAAALHPGPEGPLRLAQWLDRGQ